MNDKVKQLCYCAMLAGIMAILAQVTIPSVIPITMQTLGVYLIGALLQPRYAFIATLVYVVMGAVGLPVYGGFTGGLGILVGPTGGYIYSFPFMAFIISYLLTIKNNYRYKILAMIAGTVVCYGMGTAWFMYVTDTTFMATLTICVFPFLLGDALKIALATFLATKIRIK